MDNTEMTVMEQIARVQIKELARYLSPSALECIKKKLNNKIKAEKKREDGIKTIKDLHDEGLMSNTLYNLIFRKTDSITVNTFTVKDLFDLFGEDEIMQWRCMGPKRMEELKGLL